MPLRIKPKHIDPDMATDVELDTAVEAGISSSYTPTFVAEASIYSVPDYKQILMGIEIEVEGEIELNGDLIEV